MVLGATAVRERSLHASSYDGTVKPRTTHFLVLLSFLLLPAVSPTVAQPKARHAFALGKDDFLLDGRPFQIRGGEIQPNRVPCEYWRHRIRMAKAMGLNTIASYVFWSYHEVEEGRFDFKTWNRDIGEFFRIAQEEGMWVFLRPGPYCCAEYDFGAIPTYLLRDPELKIRCMYPRYTQAAERYLRALAAVVKPYQITEGGPILMIQLENEYGSYANDRIYMKWLHDLWRKLGITVPFATGDGATPHMLEAGSWPGAAVGLDPGSQLSHWDLARRMNPGVPIFSSETYPGWLTHWGEKWAHVSVESISKEVRFLMDNGKSFSLYVVHGGTSFGFIAGANADPLPESQNGIASSFMPDVTSYDYDSPITEQGRPTPKYFALRDLIASYLKGEKLAEVAKPIPALSIPPIRLERFTTIWDNLPSPVKLVQPKPFEALGQYQGLMLYRTKLTGHKSGRLLMRNLHDYALVFVDGILIGSVDRRLNQNSIMLPKTESKEPVLEILVEAMGHINFGEFIIDRKGITDRVLLNNMTLMNWETFGFPLEEQWVQSLKRTTTPAARPGVFLKGHFRLDKPADTFLDMTGYRKGYVWVNGNNLGRYWEIGPQKRLYCPACWLKPGDNEIVVLDLHQAEPKPIAGHEKLDD